MGEVVSGGLFERQLLCQSLVLLLRNDDVIAARDRVIPGAGRLNVRLRRRGVAGRRAGRGLVAVRCLLQAYGADGGKSKWLLPAARERNLALP